MPEYQIFMYVMMYWFIFM